MTESQKEQFSHHLIIDTCAFPFSSMSKYPRMLIVTASRYKKQNAYVNMINWIIFTGGAKMRRDNPPPIFKVLISIKEKRKEKGRTTEEGRSILLFSQIQNYRSPSPYNNVLYNLQSFFTPVSVS